VELVIIAGGKGTRLGMDDKPKPMVPLGGKPLLEHQIALAKRYGICDIYILTGYLSRVIADYFGDGGKFGVRITYVVENAPLGTAGAVKQLAEILKDRFLVFYGDILLDFDIDRFRDFDSRASCIASLIVHPNDHPFDSDLVEVDEQDVVTAFHTKQRDPRRYYRNLVNAAVYILSPDVLRHIPVDEPADFGRDIFPRLVQSGGIIRAYNTAEYIKDVGTLDRLKKADGDFTSGRVERFSKRHPRPAIFLDRDGTIVRDVHLLRHADELELYPFTAPALRKINGSDYLGLLITNQPVVARNLCSVAGLREIHNKLEAQIAEQGAYLDDIYYCPHHPDRGYAEENAELKIDCACRKPKTGMIRQAVDEFNIDLSASWMIGDTTTDLQTGKNSGMQTVLVRTGKGGKDGKHACTPDFIFDHLGEAVDFILEGRKRYEPFLAEIIDRVSKAGPAAPCVVAVAGLARSGKSSFITLLANAMSQKGIKSTVLSLDNWLVGAESRTDSMTVRERYTYAEIERDVAALLRGDAIPLPLYDPYARSVSGGGMLSVDRGSCVVIDGVPSLDIGFLRNAANVKVFVESDETVRRKRFTSFYRWKDMPDEEIELLYRKRLNDESALIVKTKQYADIIVEVAR
jgi:histidinol-phosphate phosphatase family protein